MKTLVVIMLLTFSVTVGIVTFVQSINLKVNCTGHLKRAADANSVEMAKAELKTAIDYLEEKGMTHGYTSVIYKTPDEDLGFWYTNLKTSYEELSKMDENNSQLEKSNMLMKLRETLIDHKKNGDSVTYPDGLAFYPQNLILGIIKFLAVIALLVIYTLLKL